MSPTTAPLSPSAHSAVSVRPDGRESVPSVRPDGRESVIDDFDGIANRYDLLTRLNPGYVSHLVWSAQRLHLGPNAKILDLCCGTGLSTRALLATYPDAESITGLDASAGMLAHAAKHVVTRGPKPHLSFVVGDATDPAAALGAGADGMQGGYDGILMAYGIRNVPDADRCLASLLQLLKPGAAVCFHEYSVADSPVAKAVWNAVAVSVIAPLGVLATRNVRMWNYLRESVNRFDGVSAFEQRLAQHGYVDIQTLPMNGWQRGIVHSFIARRPRA